MTKLHFGLFRRFLTTGNSNNYFAIQKRRMNAFLKPYTIPEWANCLANIPKYRVQLANADTPIHAWNVPGVPQAFTLSIKRDDTTGSTLSGNKVRKLEFLMAEAIEKRCKHVVTCGGIQSNHCRAVAVTARQLGLQPHLVLRTDIERPEQVDCTGNLLLDRLCGATMYLAPPRAPYLTELKPRMEKIQQHIKTTLVEECYHIPVGGSNDVGVFGYISVFEELISQGALEAYDDIVFACGSGGTAAGLSIANYLTGSKLKVHGVSVSDNATYFHAHCNEMLTSLGIKDTTSEQILDIIDGHKGEGYGISTTDELDFITKVSSDTGIMLDPVYTGKAAKGLIQELQDNPGIFKGNRILFLHTGGVFGLYDGRINERLKTTEHTNNIHPWKDIEISPFL